MYTFGQECPEADCHSLSIQDILGHEPVSFATPGEGLELAGVRLSGPRLGSLEKLAVFS